MSDTETHDNSQDHSQTFDPTVFDPSLYASVDNLAGTIGPNGKPIWSAEQAATYLFRAGAGYGTGGNMVMPTGGDINVLTFGFHVNQASLAANGYAYTDSSGTVRYLSEYNSFRPFTEAQKAATREAMLYWDDVVSTEFVESNINDADIAFGNYVGTGQAYARLLANTISSNPLINPQVRDIGGDIWVNWNAASNFQLDEGGYGMNTLSHEVGHGFGMLHPGDYNASPGVSLSYGANAEYYQDTRSYSILSYWNPRDIGARDFDFSVMNIAYGATPMVHDILAMQMKYGAEMTTRTGDTTYGFNSNAGRDAFDFVKTPAPTMAIWDAGGIDTLDASGYKTNQVINLTPGSLSSIGGITADEFPTFEQVNANRAAAGMAPTTLTNYNNNKNVFMTNPALYGRITDNVGIAYGAIIENAVGGSGNDSIIGNTADNVLKGNGGNDLIASGGGNDTLDGGAGKDEMLGSTGNDTYIVGEAGDIVTELLGEGTDTVESTISYTLGDNVENLTLRGGAAPVGALTFAAAAASAVLVGTGNGLANVITATGEGSFELNGGAGNDTITGGSGDDVINGGEGDDVLSGGAGNDSFVGGAGADKFIGGAGDDFYVIDDAGDSIVEGFGEGKDSVIVNVEGYVLAGGIEGVTLGDDVIAIMGNDLGNVLTGNALGNQLNGGGGNDTLIGGDGTDVFTGGAGNDTFVAEFNTNTVAAKQGALSVDVILDFNQAGDDTIDLSGLGLDLNFAGKSSGNNMGDVTWKSFGNVNAAEAALGFDIDGIDGVSTATGPVTVVFVNSDGDSAQEMALVLMNTNQVTATDFLFGGG